MAGLKGGLRSSSFETLAVLAPQDDALFCCSNGSRHPESLA